MSSADGSGHPVGPAAVSVDIAVVCRHWQELDLEGMRSSLDELGLKVAEFQEDAMQNRKRLAESTKDFRRSAEDSVAKSVAPLLKAYQEEIDRLTKRAKHGESAFLSLYQKLFDAPDPAPALSVAFETASRATELETQCRKLSHELAEYKAESLQIKNQDLTIRKLEEKVRGLEAQADDKDREMQEAADKAVADADAALMAQMQAREQELTAMLSQAQNSLAVMQKLHHGTQNQLFAIQSQSEEERVGRQTELEVASLELERAQEQLASLSREKQNLVDQLAAKAVSGPSASEAHGAGSRHDRSSMEESLRSELGLQRDLSLRLRSELAAVRRELDEAHAMWESRVEGLKATLQATEHHSHALEQEMQMRPTVHQVEELRKQIRMLQAVRYNTMDADDDGEASSGTAEGAMSERLAPGGMGHQSGSLESALLQKNRHLEHELTMARLKVVDCKTEMEVALAQIGELETQVSKQNLLINRLEEDLLSSRGSGGEATTTGQDRPLSGLLGDSTMQPAEDGEGESGQSSSMLRVLCSQRDRFRHKAVELEEELARVRTELAMAKSESLAAKADNVALVERLRYVHGFKHQDRKDVETGGVGVEVERKYGRLYDEERNPFKEFQGQQNERQKQRMGVVDKAMYKFGQLVFGSQGARLFTFMYFFILHLLVLGSLVRMTHHSSTQLYEHQQLVLDNKHDAMGVLHHEGGLRGTNSRLP